MSFALIIGHRDRGLDPCRQANLDSAVAWWRAAGIDPIVVDDGRTGTDHWNRSAAYNRGAALTDADVLVYSEADMLIDWPQIHAGITIAAENPGLVVPFSRFMAMEEPDTDLVRMRRLHPADARAQQVRGDNKSIGAVNIVSRQALDLIGGGYDQQFEGHAYDDDAMEIAFRTCCGPTRFIPGPAWHQWHIPGAYFATPESTEADRAATAANKARHQLYLQARTPERIRELTNGGD